MNDQGTSLPPMGAGNVEPERSTSSTMGSQGSQTGSSSGIMEAGSVGVSQPGYSTGVGVGIGVETVPMTPVITATSSEAGGQMSQQGSLKQKAGEKLEEGKQQAKRLGSEARQRAMGMADERKGEVSSKLSGVAEALDEFCSNLEQKGVPAQQVLGSASDWIRRFASDLDTQSTEELLRRTEARFRQSPAPFLAGFFALGFFGARLLRS